MIFKKMETDREHAICLLNLMVLSKCPRHHFSREREGLPTTFMMESTSMILMKKVGDAWEIAMLLSQHTRSRRKLNPTTQALDLK